MQISVFIDNLLLPNVGGNFPLPLSIFLHQKVAWQQARKFSKKDKCAFDLEADTGQELTSGRVKKGMVDLRGFEPLTSSMPLKRAPNCATGPRGNVKSF
jgi:hypothetical protein